MLRSLWLNLRFHGESKVPASRIKLPHNLVNITNLVFQKREKKEVKNYKYEIMDNGGPLLSENN